MTDETRAAYAAALILAVEPSDRALAGWGGTARDWAVAYLKVMARQQAWYASHGRTTP